MCAFATLFSALLFCTVIANNSVHYCRYCYCQNLNITKVPRMTSNVILITISPRASESLQKKVSCIVLAQDTVYISKDQTHHEEREVYPEVT